MTKYFFIFAVVSATLLAEAPFARVGKAATQPEYHGGAFKAFGWQRATAFCGMRNANLPGAPFVGTDASWWLTWDDTALYLVCMTALAPQGENYADDSLAIEIGLADNVGEAGVPYLRLVVQPNGTLTATSMEALPGQNFTLDPTRIAFGNHVGSAHIPGNWWLVRLRIPVDLLGVDNLAGRTAKLHLAWATAPLYLSWGGVQADDWAHMPEVFFDPAPRAGMWLNGSYPRLFHPKGSMNLDLRRRAFVGTAEEPLTFGFVARNRVANEVAWEHPWEDHMAGGQDGTWRERQQVDVVPDADNVLELAVTTASGGEIQVLFRNDLPFRPADPAVTAALADWRERHCQALVAAATFDYVYYPYTEQLVGRVSTDLNPALYAGDERARAEAIVAADHLRVTVRNAGGETVANGDDGPLQLPDPLPSGEYTVALELYGGDALADRAEMPLVRQHFPWEHTDLGKDAVIIPPWTPIERAGNALRPWGREYRFGPSGLPAAMVSQGRDVLGGAMRLTATIDGQDVAATGDAPHTSLVPGYTFPADFAKYELANAACPVAGEDFELEPTDGYAAQVSAVSHLGPIRATVAGHLDYDGLYTVDLGLDADRPATVQALTLTIPVDPGADLYRFSRITEMQCLGAVPDGEGVLVNSAELGPHTGIDSTFVPVVFVGDYDHGLFWLAESDQGWSVPDDQDQVRLVRRAGELALECRLIARPTIIAAPRTIRFALLATPARPKAVGYRQAFWAGKHTHDTAGFRFYGGGVNGFQMYEPEEYEGLRRFLHESNGIGRHYLDPADAPPGHKSYYKVRNEMAKAGHPVTLYGCTWGANAGMREFPTFGSAWTHTARTLDRRNPHTEFMNWTNFGGTAKWDTPAELTPVYTLMDDSFVDCWLWHMVRIARYSGVNGCFFDCFESLPRAIGRRVETDITGVAYRREDGRLQARANPLRYHRRTRRFATALWLAGRPPALLNSNNFDNTYGPTWFVEGPMYHKHVGRDLIDEGVTPARYAAYTASCSGMGKARSDVRTPAPGQLGEPGDHAFQMLLAYGILHDIPHGGTPGWLSPSVKSVNAALVDELDIAAPTVRHRRYWRADERPGVADPRLLAGGFVNADRGIAVVAVLNPTESTIDSALDLGGEVTDILTGKPVTALVLPAHGVAILRVR